MEEGVFPIEIKNAAIVRRRNICLREEEKKREREILTPRGISNSGSTYTQVSIREISSYCLWKF